VDASAKPPFADPTTGTARVDADPEAYTRRVLFHAMVATGASFIGRVDLMQAHYHAAMSRVGPLFARPAGHTICALILLAMLTRLISSDVAQSISMLRLARSMVKDVDAEAGAEGDSEVVDDESSAALGLLEGDAGSSGLLYGGVDDDAMSLGAGSLSGEVAAALRSEREEAAAASTVAGGGVRTARAPSGWGPNDSDDMFAGFSVPTRGAAAALAKRRRANSAEEATAAGGGDASVDAATAPPPPISARLHAATPGASVTSSAAASTETFLDGPRLHAVREGLTVRVKLVSAVMIGAGGGGGGALR
jgi:hypothetical protein